jgi:hypothetical protein
MSKTEQQVGLMPVIFQSIGLLVFGYLSFMGLNYITNGNIMLSGIVSVAGIIILYVLSYLLAYRKSKKTNRSDEQQNKTAEVLLLSVYGILFIVFSVINIHSLIIDFVQKSQLQQAGLAKVQYVRDIELAYEKAVQDKENALNTAANTLKENYYSSKDESVLDELNELLGTRGTLGSTGKGRDKKVNQDAFNNALEAKKRTLNERYVLDRTYLNTTDNYLRSAEQIFKDWKLFKTAYTYQELDVKTADYVQKTKEKMSEFTPPAFTVSSLSFTDYMGNISAAGLSSLLCLLFCLVIHFCIMAPYATSARHVKSLREVRRPTGGRGLRS